MEQAQNFPTLNRISVDTKDMETTDGHQYVIRSYLCSTEDTFLIFLPIRAFTIGELRADVTSMSSFCRLTGCDS